MDCPSDDPQKIDKVNSHEGGGSRRGLEGEIEGEGEQKEKIEGHEEEETNKDYKERLREEES